MTGFEQAYQDDAARDDHLIVLVERCAWLNARIEAKQTVGWETQWDRRERNALAWAILKLKETE